MLATKTSGHVGKPLKRVEDPRLIKGIATYVDDMKLPGLLHCVFVRSPYAHAKINSINTDAAKAVPGVVAVYTGADVNPHTGPVPCASPLPGMKAITHTLLAGNRVYFVGHPVAVIVAKDRYVARDAVELVEVDYDPLPAVSDPEKALQKDSPLTHPELGTNEGFVWTLANGDLDGEFKKADRVIKQRMVHQRLCPMAIEPRGVVAQYSPGDDFYTIHTSTQVPHLVRTMLPGMIGAAENKIRVVAPEVGGGFGSKLNVYAEEALLCFLARKLNAPMKWIESRRENVQVTIHGRDQVGYYEVAVKKDGTILAIKAKTIADVGAYNQLLTPAIPTLTGLMMTGCYKVRAMRMDVIGVWTNKMSTDAYRGAGRPEATYLAERVADIVADELGLDPVAVRLKNFPKPTEFPFDTACGLTYDSGNYQGALKKAMQMANYTALLKQREAARKQGKLFGIGLSTYVEICALGPSKIMAAGGWEWGNIRFEFSGKVTATTGVSPHGQGQETSFAQIIADKFGVPINDILIQHGDTNTATYGRDTYGSRATVVGGTALVMCADKIIAKARKLAAHLLKGKEKDCVFEVRNGEGRFFLKGKPKNALGWGELAFASIDAKDIPANFEPGLEASSFYEPANCTYPFGTHIVAVEIDRDTGEVSIVKYVAVDDCGNVINPLLVEGQVQGGIVQSLGQALMEKVVYDENGQLITGELMDYAIPRASDVPEFLLGHTVTPSPVNPLGIKGVGEAGTIGATPAVANAVVDALSPLGVKHIDLPLVPEKLWKIIQENSAKMRNDGAHYTAKDVREGKVHIPAV